MLDPVCGSISGFVIVVAHATPIVSGTPAGAHNMARENPVACAHRLISSAPPVQTATYPDASGVVGSRFDGGLPLFCLTRSQPSGAQGARRPAPTCRGSMSDAVPPPLQTPAAVRVPAGG